MFKMDLRIYLHKKDLANKAEKGDSALVICCLLIRFFCYFKLVNDPIFTRSLLPGYQDDDG